MFVHESKKFRSSLSKARIVKDFYNGRIVVVEGFGKIVVFTMTQISETSDVLLTLVVLTKIREETFNEILDTDDKTSILPK